MQCLRCTRGFAAANVVAKQGRAVRIRTPSMALEFGSKRSFSALSPRRPILSTTPITTSPSILPSSTTPSALSELPYDLTPKSAISSHPALASLQIRFAPRNTFSPSHFVRKRRHGFLSRVRTRKGRATLQRRKGKGRSTMSH